MEIAFVINWEVFRAKHLYKIDIYVYDTVESWIFFAVKEGALLKSVKIKSDNPEQNMMFINSLADLANVTKMEDIELVSEMIKPPPSIGPTEISPNPNPDGDTGA